MNKRKFIIERLQYVLAGILIFGSGYQQLQNHSIIGSIMMALGLFLMICFAYMVIKKSYSLLFKIMVLAFEGCALLFAAIILYIDGSDYIHFAYILAAIGCFAGVFINLSRHKAQKITL